MKDFLDNVKLATTVMAMAVAVLAAKVVSGGFEEADLFSALAAIVTLSVAWGVIDEASVVRSQAKAHVRRAVASVAAQEGEEIDPMLAAMTGSGPFTGLPELYAREVNQGYRFLVGADDPMARDFD